MPRKGRCPRCRDTKLVVVQRNCNHSAFSGYHYTPSDYSQVRCLGCGIYWRTKAAFVDGLYDAKGDEATRVVEGITP